MRRALALLLLLPLSSCRYAYFPPIPKPLNLEMPTRVQQVTLQREEGQLKLRVQLAGRFEAGFLKVVWYDSNKEIGRDSVYVDAAQPWASFTLDAPEAGAYRAILVFDDVALRQVELYEVSP